MQHSLPRYERDFVQRLYNEISILALLALLAVFGINNLFVFKTPVRFNSRRLHHVYLVWNQQFISSCSALCSKRTIVRDKIGPRGANSRVTLSSVLRSGVAIAKSPCVKFGFNAASEVYEDMAKAGVIDPAKVTCTALRNAASIASHLLTIETMIREAAKEVEN